MAGYTRLTHLEVTGAFKNTGMSASEFKVTSANAAAAAAAASAPSKAEFDAVVTLLNELKTDYNKLVDALSGA